MSAQDGWAVSYNGDDCRSWWDKERECYVVERRVNGKWAETCPDGHVWTWSFDSGDEMHCDDCGVKRRA